MTNIIMIFSAIVLSYSLFTWATIWSRVDTNVRTVALVSFLLLALASYPAMFEVMGWPKPIAAAWRLDGESTVLSYKLDPGEAIYLYVDGDPEPRSIVLAWSDEVAEKMHQAKEESRGQGDKDGKFKMRFDFSLDKNPRPEFYTNPVESRQPAKDSRPMGPVYERRDGPHG